MLDRDPLRFSSTSTTRTVMANDFSPLVRSQEELVAWKNELGKQGGEISDILRRLDYASVVQDSLLEKARDIAFFGYQVSDEMASVINSLGDEKRTDRAVSESIKRSVIRATQMAAQMEQKSKECEAAFNNLVLQLKEIQDDINAQILKEKKKCSIIRRHAGKWDQLASFAMSAGLIASAMSTIVAIAPSLPLAVFVVPLVIGAVTPLVSFLAERRTKFDNNRAQEMALDMNVLKDMDRKLQARIESLKAMGQWWTRVRNDVHQLNVSQESLLARTPQQIDALREHWRELESEMQNRAEALGVPRANMDKNPHNRQADRPTLMVSSYSGGDIPRQQCYLEPERSPVLRYQPKLAFKKSSESFFSTPPTRARFSPRSSLQIPPEKLPLGLPPARYQPTPAFQRPSTESLLNLPVSRNKFTPNFQYSLNKLSPGSPTFDKQLTRTLQPSLGGAGSSHGPRNNNRWSSVDTTSYTPII